MRSLIVQDKAEVDRNVRAVTSDLDSKQVSKFHIFVFIYLKPDALHFVLLRKLLLFFKMDYFLRSWSNVDSGGKCPTFVGTPIPGSMGVSR